VKLPNAENASVDIAKLRDYCLNRNHPEGKHKARVFREKLGLTRSDAEELREAILEAIMKNDAVEQTPTAYGRRFVVDFEASRSEGKGYIMSTAMVRTAWIIRNDEDFPRLTTCFNPRRSA
jgi:hypothetical protein